MIAPCLLLLVLFAYKPLVRTFELSFYGSDLFGNATRFVGLEHYSELFTDGAMRQAVLTTILITVLAVTLSVGGALAAILPLRNKLPGAAFFRVIFSLPFAFSAAVASAAFAGLLAPSVGTLNQLLAHLGITGPAWLQSSGWAIASVVAATAWYEFGFAALVVTAAVRSLPGDVMEAAALDGATGWRLNRSVVIPQIAPSIFFLVVTQTISGLQIFAQVQVLTRGGPAGSTSTMVFELYQRAFGTGVPDYGRASALAMTLLALVAVVTVVQFAVRRRIGA